MDAKQPALYTGVMNITLMGTGTSHGLPVIGCDCHVCSSPYKKDKRMRCSAYVQQGNTALLIDVGPEFRLQALRAGIKHIDAVLLTHSHADHLHGLDDLRIFSYVKLGGSREASQEKPREVKITQSEGDALPIYANRTAIEDVRYRFAYVFGQPKLGGGMPKIALVDNSQFTPSAPLIVGDMEILPVPMLHGSLPTSGYLLSCRGKDGKKHSIAYLTDCSMIPDESLSLIQRQAGILDQLIIDGLRRKPHATHCSYDEALTYAEKLSPRNVFLTHLNHDLRHREIQSFIKKLLPRHPELQALTTKGGMVSPAYDGLVLTAGE